MSSSSSTGKGEESPEGSPKKSRSARRREQYRRRHNQEKDGVENDSNKPVEKDASLRNKDTQPKTTENQAAKDVTVDSKPTALSDSNQEPVINGMPPSPESKTKAQDDSVGIGKSDVVDSNAKPDRPKELNISLNGPKENDVVGNHIEENEVHSPKDTPVVNGDIHTDEEPVMNGCLSSGGDTSPAEPAKESSESLPQRQPRERKERHKAPSTELVKEVSAMNGVVASGDQTENGVVSGEQMENGVNEDQTPVDH